MKQTYLSIFYLIAIIFISFPKIVKSQSINAGHVSQNDIYTDFEPNLNIVCGVSPHFEGDSSFYIDVDQNGIYDFVFRSVYFGALGGGTGEIVISGLNDENRILSHSETNEVYPGDSFITVNVSDTINESTVLSFENIFTTGKSYLFSSYYGPVDYQPNVSSWNNRGEHFIGFRIKPNQDTLYGWIRVEMFTNNFPDTLVVRDMACNINYNSNVADYLHDNFDIYPSPASNDLYINIDNPDMIKELEIYSTSGELVKAYTTFNLEFPLNISNLKKGSYIVLIKIGENTFRKKLIKI